jgi:D-serine deaminase-like pyridoxal phosphate-dependent protein
VHFYEGHVHGKDVAKRRRIAHEGYERLLGVVDRLADRGVAVPEIVTSGTPSFLHALEYAPFRGRRGTVHRVSPGTVVYHDLRTEQEIEQLDLLPAALVLATVVSHPSHGVVTCDAGSKSIAAEAGDPCAFVVGRPDLHAMRPSEEHLPFAVDGGSVPALGERLWLIPRHVCPTVNLADRALLVDRRSGCRIVSVDARAHEMVAEE